MSTWTSPCAIRTTHPWSRAAVAGHADAIVTGDADLLDDEPLTSWLAERGIEILTPSELVQRGFD
jgi:predicted nucleic acid-binding protein